MGQKVVVAESRSTSNVGVVRYETNRVLSGMGHDRYPNRQAAFGPKPTDELARRLFDTGKVDAVHVNSNIITVTLARGADTDGLGDIVEDLYTYYVEGVTPPTF